MLGGHASLCPPYNSLWVFNIVNIVFSSTETTFLLPGPDGQLEVLAAPADQPEKNITVVICHPHPLYGGTMYNKVVTTLARTFKEMHMRTVRFNFRGIGKSDGSYGQGIGEVEDLLAVLQWVKQVRPHDDIWLAGFSFGSYIAACGAHQWPDVKQLICVAPAVEHFSFKELYPFPCPWLVVQGEADEIVPPHLVFDWLASLPKPPTLIRMPETSHFFHSKLGELRQWLQQTLG
jgi:alpha/beta superfamily hydrolase